MQDSIRYMAVLMTVHNRKDKTMTCLERLYSQEGLGDGVEVEVWLTDDGCTDGTPEAIRTAFPKVNIVSGDGTLFWNRGMYAAWRAALSHRDYDFYLWLNDDTFLREDALARLLASSEAHDDKSIIVGSTCAVGNPLIITYGGWQQRRCLAYDVSKENVCETFEGNIVLIPRSVYLILGTNDPMFHHAVGDTDYGYRATKVGIGIYTGIGIFGECDAHARPSKWMDPQMPLKVRWKDYFSPYCSAGEDAWHFRKRHFGTANAIKTIVTSFLHMLFPGLYDKLFAAR